MNKKADIVALDLDSVLADTESMVLKMLRDKFGLHLNLEDFNGYEFEKQLYITEEMSDYLIKSISTGEMFEGASMTNYAEHAINKLHNNGFMVYIITKRPEHLQPMTEKWLKQNNLEYDKLYLVDSKDKKASIIEAAGIKAFVEDRFDTLMGVLKRCGQPEYGLYCVRYPWTEKFHHDQIVKVKHVAEAVDRIVDYRRWKGYFLNKCVGNVDKFVKEYNDGGGWV
ncbi:hypothetical protein LCGC14_1029630 [marine sediment metagenome]|uniref:Nucleotidase n=1 Tax=marine sediment metagenome TaxID=412755 RepID=A0A0F9QD09_9ZZZZ